MRVKKYFEQSDTYKIVITTTGGTGTQTFDSEQFTVTVTRDCAAYISVVSPLSPSTFTFTQVISNSGWEAAGLPVSSYVSTSNTAVCPLSAFTLKTVSPDAAYSGSFL